MLSNRMAALWARTALAWFLVAVGLGLFMGITQKFNYAPAHAHMGVLGWLSAGVISYLHALSRPFVPGALLPRLHWAVHNLGVAAMTGSLFLEMHYGGGFGPFIAVGAIVVVVAVIWLAAMMWGRVGAVEASPD
ncbi:MAG TPA: hypothetical protein VHM92_03295 [Allosphingosinicella sp.]|nr:hypothetical protein [Allosphingosinicella sp.]